MKCMFRNMLVVFFFINVNTLCSCCRKIWRLIIWWQYCWCEIEYVSNSRDVWRVHYVVWSENKFTVHLFWVCLFSVSLELSTLLGRLDLECEGMAILSRLCTSNLKTQPNSTEALIFISHSPEHSRGIHHTVGQASLFSVAISPCPVLAAIVSQLFLSGDHL
jgi:hypothetical protein